MENEIKVDEENFQTVACSTLEKAIEELNNVSETWARTQVEEFGMPEFFLKFLHPVVFAEVLMQNLDGAMGNTDSLEDEEKLFWAKVSMELGPDWVAKFRRIGAFMAAVDKA